MTDVISDLPRDDRPRERLLTHGPETLSDAELVAILLGSGVQGKNAIQLARELLRDGMSGLRRQDVKQLEQIAGVGPAKIARISAAFEISRRIINNVPDEPPSYETAVLGRTLVTSFARVRQERLGAAFLDSRHRMLRQREIYIGTINNALVSTRDIITEALMNNATAVVVYHNHPSGSPAPSDDDINFTNKLKHSLWQCDIELLDHLIVGAHGFYSMRERGLLN
ncbi:MAG: DNA repair protein RadC [Acidobacteriota bacterium]|nr:DNA repair protein RadC [Acidobacteriota bacterium]